MQRIDFENLVTYNAEISRGIIHTDKHNRKMKILQRQYNKEMRKKYNYETSRSGTLNDNEGDK